MNIVVQYVQQPPVPVESDMFFCAIAPDVSTENNNEGAVLEKGVHYTKNYNPIQQSGSFSARIGPPKLPQIHKHTNPPRTELSYCSAVLLDRNLVNVFSKNEWHTASLYAWVKGNRVNSGAW